MAACPACKRALPDLPGLEPSKRDEVAFALGLGERDEAAAIVAQAAGLKPDDARAYLDCPHRVPATAPPPQPPPTLCPVCNLPMPGPDAAQIVALLLQGRKPDAVRLVRERTGWGLANAQAFVDCPHDPSLVRLPPGHTQGPPSLKRVACAGCLTVVILGLGAFVAATFLRVQTRQEERRAPEPARARACSECGQPLPAFPNETPEDRDALVEHIRFGRKPSAIQLVRRRTGWGLEQARAFVDCPHRVPVSGK